MGGGPVEDDKECEDVHREHDHERKHRPVISTLATGGAVGFILGSMVGVGASVGSTAGALIGASLASRQDEVGAKIRKTTNDSIDYLNSSINKVSDRLSSEKIFQEAVIRFNDAVQEVSRLDQQYKVSERVTSAANTTAEIAKPKIEVAFQEISKKATELDKHEYISKMEGFVNSLDTFTGFSRSVRAIREELKN